jgi:hypothetical protein
LFALEIKDDIRGKLQRPGQPVGPCFNLYEIVKEMNAVDVKQVIAESVFKFLGSKKRVKELGPCLFKITAKVVHVGFGSGHFECAAEPALMA